MARSRKSHDSGKEDVKTSRSHLESPYSGKVGGNKLVVYVDLRREGDDCPRVLVLNFAAKYAARYFIDLLIHNDEWEWVDPIGSRNCIRTTAGVRISMFGDALKMLLDYQMSEAERAWENDGIKQSVLRFKYGTQEVTKRDNQEQQDGTDETPGDGGAVKKQSGRKEPRTPKEPKVKVDKSDFVSANDIAGELKVEGREVRVALRASGMTKPDIGWMWPKDSKELKEARKTIEANLKKKAGK